MSTAGKSIVVTGASSGMGKRMVEVFAQDGANVVAFARRKERLDALKESLADAPGKVAVYAGDVSHREDIEGALDLAVSEFGRLDVLVNNAGVMDDMAPIAEASDERYEKVMAVNVYGPMAAMRRAVQIFQEQGEGGNIINISSVGSMHQAAGPIYCASKAALNAMARNTAFVYQKDHIRVNTIAAGGFNTEIANSMGMPNANGWEAYGKICGLATTGEPDDIARIVRFLADDDSSFIDGVVLPVDNGWASF